MAVQQSNNRDFHQPNVLPCFDESHHELGRYQNSHNGPTELWYTCAVRKRAVYLWIPTPVTCQDTIRHAMQYALDNNLDAIKVPKSAMTRWETGYERCLAKPLRTGFNADYLTVDYSQLSFVSSIARNV